MTSRLEDQLAFEVGDRIRVHAGNFDGQIGALVDNVPRSGRVLVEFPKGLRATYEYGEYTNLSLAARRGHQRTRAAAAAGTRNPRGAGRKRHPDGPRKRLVTMRLDAEYWRRLGEYVKSGRLRSKEGAMNDLLEELVHSLDIQAREAAERAAAAQQWQTDHQPEQEQS